jgi:DNA-directed RNA polymerase subunit RPC12/RpoP
MGHKYVCLDCQKAVNLNTDYTIAEKHSQKCTECGEAMALYPHRFRPPRKNADKKWAVIRYLYQNGLTYHHIAESGRNGYSKYPETMKEAIEFVQRLRSGQ